MTTIKTAAKPETKAVKKSSTNGWSEETTAKAIELYTASLGEKGDDIDTANSAANLKTIMEATGAKSIHAVRSKLTSEKVYVKPDSPRKVGGGSSLRKAHYVRALANHAVEIGMVEEDEKAEFDSLENAKMDTLALVCKLMDLKVTAE